MSRPKLLNPPTPIKPKTTRHEMAPDVAAAVGKIITDAEQQLRGIQERLQAGVDAGVGALCGLEAGRLGLAPGWQLSADRKALEVIEEPKK